MSTNRSQQSAAAYIHSSSEKQDDALSLEVLEEQIRERAQQDGNEIVAVYTDSVESGDRPGIQEMLKGAEQGRFDYLYVNTIHCLDSQLERIIEIIQQLQELDVTLKSVEEFDLDTPMGDFCFNMLAALDEFFSTHQDQDNREVIQHA